MGACNFWTMDDFDLWVMDDEKLCRFYLGEEFIEERKEEFEDYNPIDDIELAWDMLLEDIQSDFDDLKSHLEWYTIELKSGYYDGAQFYIDTKYCGINDKADWLQSKPLIWDDEECLSEFGLSRQQTIKMIEEEKRLINEFLENSKDYGFYKINCVGVFNNGEAVYELA